MKEREVKEVIGMLGNGISPYALISEIVAANARENAKLTPEERAKRNERIRKTEEQRIIRVKVTKSICPSCDGKLTRGKKDKKNDYKRKWACGECKNTYHL